MSEQRTSHVTHLVELIESETTHVRLHAQFVAQQVFGGKKALFRLRRGQREWAGLGIP